MVGSIIRHRSVQASAATGVVFAACSVVTPLPWWAWGAWGALTVASVVQAVRAER